MERTEQRQVVSLLVDNQTGVLARVSAFSAAGASTSRA